MQWGLFVNRGWLGVLVALEVFVSRTMARAMRRATVAAPVVDKPKRRGIGAVMSRTTMATGQGRCSVRAGEVPDEYANAHAEVEELGGDDRIYILEEERGEGMNRA